MDRPNRSTSPPAFRDRVDAGERLAEALRSRIGDVPREDLVVIGLVRGGVVVAAEVARLLGARLEAIVVRKLGAPRQPELAIGAITAGPARVLNRPLIAELRLSERQVARISERAQDEALALARELDVPPQVPGIAGKTTIIVDDGLATGATMRVAIDAVQRQGSARAIVAVPVAPAGMLQPFRTVADDVVAVVAAPQLNAVGRWYEVFDDVPSTSVRAILRAAHRAGETQA